MTPCLRCGDPHGRLRVLGLVILCDGCPATATVATLTCWRCGCPEARLWLPHSLCEPCLDVVSPEEIAGLPGPPLGLPCGR